MIIFFTAPLWVFAVVFICYYIIKFFRALHAENEKEKQMQREKARRKIELEEARKKQKQPRQYQARPWEQL